MLMLGNCQLMHTVCSSCYSYAVIAFIAAAVTNLRIFSFSPSLTNHSICTMNAVKLTNLPRMDMPRLENHQKSRHVYPFWDRELATKYGSLNLPSTNMVQTVAETGHHPAIKNTWFDVTVTHFGTGRGTVKRWPRLSSPTLSRPREASRQTGVL